MSSTIPNKQMKQKIDCRPNNHPEENKWPPEIPENYQASVEAHVKEGEQSTKAFHKDLAVEAFGIKYMKQLEGKQKDFQGDWFQLAYLLRCHETPIKQRRIDVDGKICRCPFCQKAWSRSGGIHLENAKLTEAPLQYAMLYEAHLENAELFAVHLENAKLYRAHLENANLRFGHLENAKLQGAHLENTDLSNANLENAELGAAHLKNARFEDTILDGAEVREAKGIVFDNNRVDRLLIEGNATDPWSKLRRAYTGPRFFFHLLLLTAFLLPYIGKAVVLTGISHVMKMINQKLAAIPPDLQPLQDYREGMDEQTALWALLGFTDNNPVTIFFFGLALLMIAYNVLRGYLTVKVSDLREAEDRAKITPRRNEYMGKTDRSFDTRSWWAVLWSWCLALKDWGKNSLVLWWMWWKGDAEKCEGECKFFPWPFKYLGLYRVHQMATVFMYVGYGALLLQIIRWLLFTRIPASF